MKGLYIHIPFCKQACRYCDFYFTVNQRHQDPFITGLLKEIELRAGDLPRLELDSLYVGGGTPSLLKESGLQKMMKQVRRHYGFSDHCEVSIECNPDDINDSKARFLRELGFNRLSIGIQSFREEDLRLMRRSHNAEQAGLAVRLAAAAGFENITVDLIYGIPGQSPGTWKENILRALELPVNHISAYHLTFEPKTVFELWRKKGKIVPVPEEESVELYQILRETLKEAGFEHYEISNFAREGWRSRHNQLYWSGEPYIGFGPSAHSFDGNTRSWNPASIHRYIKAMEEGHPERETEQLSTRDKYHDYLITSLRTSEGAETGVLGERFGKNIEEYFRLRSSSFLEQGVLLEENGRILINPESWLLADHIMRELFLD